MGEVPAGEGGVWIYPCCLGEFGKIMERGGDLSISFVGGGKTCGKWNLPASLGLVASAFSSKCRADRASLLCSAAPGRNRPGRGSQTTRKKPLDGVPPGLQAGRAGGLAMLKLSALWRDCGGLTSAWVRFRTPRARGARVL